MTFIPIWRQYFFGAAFFSTSSFELTRESQIVSTACKLVILLSSTRNVMFLLVISVIASGCFHREAPPVGLAPIVSDQPRPEQESWDVDLYQSEDGTMRVRIRAAYMANYQVDDSTYSLLTRISAADPQVHADISDGETGTTIAIDADEIRYFEKDNRFEARGSVKVVSSTGKTLLTEFLIWRELDHRIKAPGFVQIISPTENINGYGFDADELLDNFSLGKVTGRYFLEDE